MTTDNNVPIVITILLAIAAWTFTHATNRFLQEPIVKVSQNTTSDTKINNRVTITLTNITKHMNFKGMEVQILGEHKDNRFTVPELTIVGSGWTPTYDLNQNRDGIDVQFSDFHPGWEVELTTTMSGQGTPRIHLKNSQVPAVLQQAGLKTCIIENEILISTSFGLLAIVCVLVWLVFYHNNYKAK